MYQHFNGVFLCTVDHAHEVIFWKINDSPLHLSRIPLTFKYQTQIHGYVLGWLKSDLILVVQEEQKDVISIYRFELALSESYSSLTSHNSLLTRLFSIQFCCEHQAFLSTRFYGDYESIALCCVVHGRLGIYRFGK
jgi:hypothetical protein